MLPPDDHAARKHWQAQQPALDRPLGTIDPGLTAVDGAQDIARIISQESQGQATPVYRQRTAENLPDPVARTTRMIRSKTRRKVSAETFYRKCENPTDLALHSLLYGDMDDAARASLLLKLAKQLDEQQTAVERLNLQRQNLDEKRIRNALELDKKLSKLQKLGIIQGEVVDPNQGKDGDA